jgi:hypothetical protein
MIKILELFAGSQSFSKQAKLKNYDTFTSDWKEFNGIDYAVDILKFDINKLPWKPDVIWASPPCTTFSIASCGTHWTPEKEPKTDACKEGIKIVKKTVEIIKELNPKYFIIENPRGLLRKLNLIDIGKLNTIWYCQYGDERAKPTDLWTNIKSWTPRPVCWNGNKDCHHAPAPRGSRTGTQGRSNPYERSKVPNELCIEILNEVSK